MSIADRKIQFSLNLLTDRSYSRIRSPVVVRSLAVLFEIENPENITTRLSTTYQHIHVDCVCLDAMGLIVTNVRPSPLLDRPGRTDCGCVRCHPADARLQLFYCIT